MIDPVTQPGLPQPPSGQQMLSMVHSLGNGIGKEFMRELLVKKGPQFLADFLGRMETSADRRGVTSDMMALMIYARLTGEEREMLKHASWQREQLSNEGQMRRDFLAGGFRAAGAAMMAHAYLRNEAETLNDKAMGTITPAKKSVCGDAMLEGIGGGAVVMTPNYAAYLARMTSLSKAINLMAYKLDRQPGPAR